MYINISSQYGIVSMAIPFHIGSYAKCKKNVMKCICTAYLDSRKKFKKINSDQELIQSDPTSCPQNQKGNSLIHKFTAFYERHSR